MVGESITEFNECCGFSSIVHNLLFCLVPCIIILPFRKMKSLFLSKVAVHPASHSCPMERRDPDARWGKMCVLLASFGSVGRSRSVS